MKIVLSDKAHQDINNLFNYKVELYKNVYCETFKKYLADIFRSLDIIEKDADKVFKQKDKDLQLINIVVEYTSFIDKNNDTFIWINRIKYLSKKLNSMIQLCVQERKSKSTKYKLPVSSKNISDYKHIPNGYCGQKDGKSIYIVQRINTSNPILFNYLYDSKILSKYDFISCGTFFQYENEYKAKAAASRQNWYWVYTNGKIVKIDSKILRDSFDNSNIASQSPFYICMGKWLSD